MSFGCWIGLSGIVVLIVFVLALIWTEGYHRGKPKIGKIFPEEGDDQKKMTRRI